MRDLMRSPERGAVEPWWLNLELFGFEDDDEDDDDLEEEDEDLDDDDEEEDDEESDDDEDDEDSDEDEDEDDEDGKSKKSKPKKKNTAGLVKALRRERMANKRNQRQVRQLKAQLREAKQGPDTKKPKPKNKGNGSKDEDKEEQETQDTGPSEREKKLAVGLLTTAVDREILAVATKLKFLDPEDAVRLIDRKDIEVDQDDEDPTEIEIDRESVEDAVKELAKKKKHLINRGGTAGGRTGSQVGSRRKKGEVNDAALRKKFNLGPARR